MLRTERQSARMSKITNDDLTRSGTGCFIYSCSHMATVGFKGLTATRVIIHHMAQFSSISSIVLRGKVSERPA